MANNEVEQYKITPEMKVWLKSYGKIQRVLQGVRLNYEVQKSELASTEQMLNMLDGQRQQLLNVVPPNQTHDNDAPVSVDSMEINY